MGYFGESESVSESVCEEKENSFITHSHTHSHTHTHQDLGGTADNPYLFTLKTKFKAFAKVSHTPPLLIHAHTHIFILTSHSHSYIHTHTNSPPLTSFTLFLSLSLSSKRPHIHTLSQSYPIQPFERAMLAGRQTRSSRQTGTISTAKVY